MICFFLPLDELQLNARFRKNKTTQKPMFSKKAKNT